MTGRLSEIVDRAKTGALKLMICCFLASGLLRLVIVAPALAVQLSGAADAAGDVTPMENQLANCPAPPDPDALIGAIRERERQLANRELRINEQLEVLAVAREEFEKQKDELIAAEEKLSETLAIADNAAEGDIRQITAVYENMKPKSAAEVFNTMDQKFAAGFLIRMNPQAAADIISNMDPEVAYAVSLLMANRNIEAPRE